MLVVMVGEQVQEMQLAGWIPTTEVGIPLPGWMGTWFAAFPNVAGLVAQGLAGRFVIGSYLVVERKKHPVPGRHIPRTVERYSVQTSPITPRSQRNLIGQSSARSLVLY